MDYNRIIEVIVASIFGGGGTVSIINLVRARRSRRAGVSRNEEVAASQIPAVGLATPDWEALTRYWQAELKLTREDYRKHRIECEKQHRADGSRIDELEAHIWERKQPPPPPDKRGTK